MAVPFGFSAGDFIAGIKLCKNAFDALSNSRGACADYKAVRETLDVLEKAFDTANQISAPHTRPVVVDQIAKCKECIKTFLRDFAKFELLKSEPPDKNKAKFAFRKLQWSLCTEDDIRKFREHLQMHIDALQLQLSILQIDPLFETFALATTIKSNTETIKGDTTTALQLQKDLTKTLKNTHETQMQRFSDVDKSLQSSSRATTAVSYELEKFHDRFRIVEGHLIEVKGMLHLQQQVPPRVLHAKIFQLLDPFETNTLTIPLDTIDSFEALLAVFSVRFKYKGEAALSLLRHSYSAMYDHAALWQTDLSRPWSRAFKHGQTVEMSVLFPGIMHKVIPRCPGCNEGGETDVEGKRITCTTCHMVYRWIPYSPKTLKSASDEIQHIWKQHTQHLRKVHVSTFRRIDILKCEPWLNDPSTQHAIDDTLQGTDSSVELVDEESSPATGGAKGNHDVAVDIPMEASWNEEESSFSNSTEDTSERSLTGGWTARAWGLWYCCQCRDGPHGFSGYCTNCFHAQCGSCSYVTYDDLSY